MTQVKLLLDKTKQIFLPKESSNLVFNFQDIFDAWTMGKCTTEYLHQYCMTKVAQEFLNELERIKK